MATKVKAKAATVAVPQSKTDCAAYIKNLGDIQRDFERQRAEMNDAIANITKQYQPALEALTTRMTNLQEGIQTWCAANRTSLCPGESKTANLITGEVSWRKCPPSVSIRGVEAVIETLKRMALGRFVRSKEEINKEAILNEKDAVRGIPGITIVSDVEDFAITPFAVDVEVA